MAGRWAVLNEVPEHMAQESGCTHSREATPSLLNEVPEHMAQECLVFPKLLANILVVLNEVPEHMAQEYA